MLVDRGQRDVAQVEDEGGEDDEEEGRDALGQAEDDAR